MPLVNGCRAAALSRACKQDLEGWLGRQECFKLEQVFSDKKAARQLQWLAHRCPQLRYLELGIVIVITGRTYVLDEAIQAVAWGRSTAEPEVVVLQSAGGAHRCPPGRAALLCCVAVAISRVLS